MLAYSMNARHGDLENASASQFLLLTFHKFPPQGAAFDTSGLPSPSAQDRYSGCSFRYIRAAFAISAGPLLRVQLSIHQGCLRHQRRTATPGAAFDTSGLPSPSAQDRYSGCSFRYIRAAFAISAGPLLRVQLSIHQGCLRHQRRTATPGAAFDTSGLPSPSAQDRYSGCSFRYIRAAFAISAGPLLRVQLSIHQGCLRHQRRTATPGAAFDTSGLPSPSAQDRYSGCSFRYIRAAFAISAGPLLRVQLSIHQGCLRHQRRTATPGAAFDTSGLPSPSAQDRYSGCSFRYIRAAFAISAGPLTGTPAAHSWTNQRKNALSTSGK